MAEGIVYLDVDDEITSAASRIRNSPGTKVALVVPYGSRIATSRMNFRLLSRDEALRHQAGRFFDTALPVLVAMTLGLGERTVLTREVVEPARSFFEALASAAERTGASQLAADVRSRLRQLSPETLTGLSAAEALRRLGPLCAPSTDQSKRTPPGR